MTTHTLLKTSLSKRERVRLALAHQETDRIPIAMACSWIHQPAYREFEELLQKEKGMNCSLFLDEVLDVVPVSPAYVGPALLLGVDVWGVQRKSVSYGAGSYDEISFNPLAHAKGIQDIERYPWPNPNHYDYAGFGRYVEALQKKRDCCLMIETGSIFEISWYMRGFEQIFMDMVTEPELVHEMFNRVTQFHIERFTKMLVAARGNVDLVFTGDDIAGQNGLLLSLNMWEEFIKPYHARLNKALHEFGVKVMYHSDGAVMDAVGGLVDMGIDVLQALQFDARGMDAAQLKNKFGDRLCFEGGVSVQKTLPFGKPDEVRAETAHLIRTLGKQGGYILGPAHAIQAGTPAENIMAMFDVALTDYPFVSVRVF
jgi:uroporphyrinogen decarboxylase